MKPATPVGIAAAQAAYDASEHNGRLATCSPTNEPGRGGVELLLHADVNECDYYLPPQPAGGLLAGHAFPASASLTAFPTRSFAASQSYGCSDRGLRTDW